MNIIIWGVRIIEDSDNRGSDSRGCTVQVKKKALKRNAKIEDVGLNED